MQNFWGQQQDSWSCALAANSEHWDPDSDLSSLLLFCALSSSTKTAQPDSWAHVKTRNHGHGRSYQVESQTNFRSKTSQFTGSRFAVLADDMDDSFPVFNVEQKQHVPKPEGVHFQKEFLRQLPKALSGKRTKVIAHSASK